MLQSGAGATQISRDDSIPSSQQPITSRWRLTDLPPDGFHLDLGAIAGSGNLAIASALLYNRGIRNYHEANAFLYDGFDKMHPPDVLPGMQQAVDVILSAVKQEHGIAILGDFDADGITATAIIILTLRKLGLEAKYHLPHREIEGHGISVDALERFAKQHVKVVITVDTGITAFDEVDVANKLGIQVVITDHHIPAKDRLPNAAAIVNQHLSNDDGLADFCGAVTAFKLALALLAEAGMDPAQELIPLAAVGTLADQMELMGDNRIIVREGLNLLDSKHAPLGLRELVSLIRSQRRHYGPYDAEFVNFQLAPRINAPGRIDSADPSLKLLIETSAYTATNLAKYLDDANLKRRDMATKAWRAAKPSIEEAVSAGHNIIAIEVDPTLPMGILGPLAGQASEHAASPAFAYQVVDGVARASARSIPSFDIHAALEGISHRLKRFGGHAAAAGFATEYQHIPEIVSHLEMQMSWSGFGATVQERSFRTVEIEMRIHQLGHSLWEFVDKMAPFGLGNPEPLFLLRKATVASIGYMGRQQNHVRLNLKDDTGRSYRAVGFNMADSLPPTRIVDAVVSLKTNHYRGRMNRELSLHDISAS